MNIEDYNEIALYYRQATGDIHQNVDYTLRFAQDYAYALGLKRGKTNALKLRKTAILSPLSDHDISGIAGKMPGGINGFMKEWGWHQFARAIEEAHGIKITEPTTSAEDMHNRETNLEYL